MDNSESVLVLISFIFAIVLFVIILFRGPNMGIVNKGIYFDKSQIPLFLKFLLAVVIVSFPIGLVVAADAKQALGFTGLNSLLAAIMGLNLFLYKRRSSD